VLDVLSDPSFVESRRLGPEAIQRWELHLTRAQQRWGLDAAHRKASFGVDITNNKQADEQHSWLHSVRRILLGAAAERGGEKVLLDHGIVPDVETDELEDVLELVELIDTIRGVVVERHTKKTPSDWAVLLDAAFSQFCGPFSKLTSMPLRQLRRLASLSGVEESSETMLSFDEVVRFLTNQFGVVSDKRLTRSGEVVATGLGAQSHVPYRVICLVGVDDAAMPSGGRDGFDLAARDNLVGDPDPRHDVRRQLLTAVLSAADRVIITCDGRDLKNNQEKNLAAPLDELVSWCADSGEELPEILHPRHLYSPRNFLPNGVRGLQPWSYDHGALEVAEAMQAEASSEEPDRQPVKRSAEQPSKELDPNTNALAPTRPEISMLQLRALRDMLFYPLSVFLRWSYNIFKDWEDRPTDNTLLSLDLTNDELDDLSQRLMHHQIAAAQSGKATASTAATKQWKADNRRLHRLPVTDAAKDATEKLVEEVVESAVEEWKSLSSPPLTDFESRRLELKESEIVLEGEVPTEPTTTVVEVRFDGRALDIERNTDLLQLQLIFYRACGYLVDKIQVIAMNDSFPEYEKERDSQRGPKTPKTYAACTSYEIGWASGEAPTADEAITWLAALVELYRRAAGKPVPTFAPTQKNKKTKKLQLKSAGHLLYIANTPKEAEDTFNEITQPSEFLEGFAGTEEALIYGVEPVFKQCFPIAKSETDERPFEQQFWIDRDAWWQRPSWNPVDSSPQFQAEIHLPDALRPIADSTDGNAS
jgi:hypothetical protein